MLTLFLNLIDRTIKLVELRQADKRQLFKDVIEPLFLQFQPVVDDYFDLFRRAKILAIKSKNNDDLRLAMDEVRSHREKMVQARLAVVEFAKTVQSQVEEKRVKQFARKMAGFFFSTQVDQHRRWSGPATLVELFEYVASDCLDKGKLVSYIDETLRRQEDSWISIAQAYAVLRVHCMSPARYVERLPTNHDIDEPEESSSLSPP